MKRKLYQDAITTLLADIKGKADESVAVEHLMLGECYYLESMYAEARPYLAKAHRNLPDGKEKATAEYRLACTAFNMKDSDEGIRRTDAFVTRNGQDKRCGTLLLYKMKALATRGKAGVEQLESVRKQIKDGIAVYGAAADVTADKILTDFYRDAGLQQRAVDGYVNIVRSFQAAAQQYAAESKPVPRELEEAHDRAAMSLAGHYVDQKNFAEATKWLDSVRFDDGLKAKARILLAQVAYQKQDYRAAEKHLLDNGFLDNLPPGPLRSEANLLLGFCAKRASQPKLDQVERYFSQVAPDSPAYGQAQMGLADSLEKWREFDRAIEAYERAASSPLYEAASLARLGELYLQKGQNEKATAKQTEAFQKAADRFTRLSAKYPSSQEARLASDSIKLLRSKGFTVKLAVTDEELIAQHEAIVTNRPGSADAARALLQLVHLHVRELVDEKTGNIVKAPDYPATAAACGRLLDDRVYQGRDIVATTWANMQAEALYYRATANLASFGRSGQSTNNPTRYLATPNLAQAVADLAAAAKKVDAKQEDLARNIEIANLEAMFKGGDESARKQARALYGTLIEKYAQSPRLQKFAYDLAAWYQEQGDNLAAAREYEAIAKRGTALSPDDRVKLYFTAGRLYSMKANEVRKSPAGSSYALYVYPREVIETAGLIQTHDPFQSRVKPGNTNAIEMAGDEALAMVSRLSGIPFVWSPEPGAESVADYLRRKRVPLAPDAEGTVEEWLGRVLDTNTHVLAFDIGITGGRPTLPPASAAEREDPDVAQRSRPIEIADKRTWDLRYEPLRRNYGAWQPTHGKRTMMFRIAQRIEQVCGVPLTWAEGINKDDVLAGEFDQIPGVPPAQDCPAGVVLRETLGRAGYKFRVVPRQPAAEFYDAARACFNEVYRLSPRSPYGEKSLFQLAMNFYALEQYDKMRIALEQYLRTFDNPSFDYYHQACFWVGWVLERDKRWHDANTYYRRAAEEQVVVSFPATNTTYYFDLAHSRDQFSYDTLAALDEPIDGSIPPGSTFPNDILNALSLYTGLKFLFDPTAQAFTTNFSFGTFRQRSSFSLLSESLQRCQMIARPENVNKEIAEKAYFRIALCAKREGAPEIMLPACRAIVNRFPKNPNRKEAYRLMLDAHKEMEDYANVLKTLEGMRRDLEGQIEGYLLNFEMGAIHFDLCRYDEAAANFRQALATCPSPAERVKIREALARSLFMDEKWDEALPVFQTLVAEEKDSLRAFVHELTAWYLERRTGRSVTDNLPPTASEAMRTYEAMKSGEATAELLARVTWVYYVGGRLDLDRNESARAMEKFAAAANSPDDWLAAESLYRSALIHIARKNDKQAKEALEHLLFTTHSPETEVKTCFQLALCNHRLDLPKERDAAFDRLMRKFADSAYAKRVEEERLRFRPGKGLTNVVEQVMVSNVVMTVTNTVKVSP
jgi:tetratricopeptide (TPR) repeat protein